MTKVHTEIAASVAAAKMNGAGNAIVVLDLRGRTQAVSGADAIAIHAMPGLAFDQLMVVRDADAPHAGAMTIFNNDGSLAQSCGNGTRCVAHILMRDGANDAISLLSDSGLLSVHRDGPWRFTVDMGPPHLDWAEIPLARASNTKSVTLEPNVAGVPQHFSAVSMGNPHAIFFVDDLDAIDLAHEGRQIEHHPLFPERVNTSFARIDARDHVTARVWERGAGATLACGSAACATLVAGVRAGVLDRAAAIVQPGGTLQIVWRESDGHVLMSGPVELEFEMQISFGADGPYRA